MTGIVFIGDELTAAGFRLTGIEVAPHSPDAVRGAFAQARKQARIVLLTADYARYIPADELDDALLTEEPIIAIIPDILNQSQPPSAVGRLRSVLGIET